jgi:hypothetical protein
MLTERDIYLAALASIEIHGDAAADRANEQVERLRKNGSWRRSRAWTRVQVAILEIQRDAREGDERLN